MKTREVFSREIGKLEKEADELKTEVRIQEYCRTHGLNYHDSGDYARAVNGLSKDRRGAGGAAIVLPYRDNTEGKLLMRKPIGGADSSCYNGNDTERITRILDGLENVSRYGRFNDMGDKIKNTWDKAKEKAGGLEEIAKEEALKIAHKVWKGTGGRRNIRNNTDAEICVTGNTEDEVKKLIYLHSQGEESSSYLYDADGVVILDGQRFYVDESDIGNKGRTYTTGVIKVKDAIFGYSTADVCYAPDEKDTFYIHATGNTYLTISQARGEHWKLP